MNIPAVLSILTRRRTHHGWELIHAMTAEGPFWFARAEGWVYTGLTCQAALDRVRAEIDTDVFDVVSKPETEEVA